MKKGSAAMAIKYQKFFTLLEEKGFNKNSLRKNKVIGVETLEKMKKGVGHIDDRSINNLCAFLDCQPSDFMEYIKDEPSDD